MPEAAMGAATTISATELQATCPEVLDRVQSSEFSHVQVTQGEEVVAVATRPAPTPMPEQARDLFGALRGRVIIPPSVDLKAPTREGPSAAELGILHR
jgi:antitoxin (DNA-binding transcriptional repressor) of toxin-antitoxin stability system